ncbi:rhodanese-related sulfurtransferase [Haloactinopolyspora alba]|uniref:Rhodanese-related sulfurtransferase n=1 Tax=Haloactinopolyspora alba TaxID=648780 RepID=A0A2P8DM12_9ACTN|nr:rhodanese-like domain-containing protein [Haloactinopolyspora alba]PSK98238.1 rhodanese-related sulfurtransferase [Haloactinopolyspora alba]
MSAAEVSVDELAVQWNDGAFVVDVREPEEYEQAHIPGAELIPMGGVVTEHERVPRDRPVYVVCAVGGRSAQVAEFLSAQGVDARNVSGGTLAWIRAGHPVDTGAPES